MGSHFNETVKASSVSLAQQSYTISSNRNMLDTQAIKIEHSPQFKKIYTNTMQDYVHVHTKTFHRAIQAQTLQLDGEAIAGQSFNTMTLDPLGVAKTTSKVNLK